MAKKDLQKNDEKILGKEPKNTKTLEDTASCEHQHQRERQGEESQIKGKQNEEKDGTQR